MVGWLVKYQRNGESGHGLGEMSVGWWSALMQISQRLREAWFASRPKKVASFPVAQWVLSVGGLLAWLLFRGVQPDFETSLQRSATGRLNLDKGDRVGNFEFDGELTVVLIVDFDCDFVLRSGWQVR